MMKRFNLLSLLSVLMLALPLTFVSCGDDDDPVTPEPDPVTPDTPTPDPETPSSDSTEYTIIYYGHGGGDLDFGVLDNINDLFLADKSSYKKVSAAVQYKMSGRQGLTEYVEWADDLDEDFDVDKYAHKTFRFVVDPSKDFEKMFLGDISDITLPDRDLDIAKTENLTDFIKWAVKKCPAQKYILVLSDHGGGYSPEDDLPENQTLSKGLVYDDGANYDHLTVQKLSRAITESGIHPEVIYLDACLMNTIEYQFELKDLANYLVLSAFSVPGPGGDYVALVDNLARNNNIEDALSKFCKACVNRWDGENDDETGETAYPYSDMSVIRTSAIDAFGAQWKEFTSRLIDAYQSDEGAKAAIDEVTAGTFAMELGMPLYDMVYYAREVMSSLPAYFDADFAKGLLDAYDATIVSSNVSAPLAKYGYQIGCSILFGCKGHYTSYSWDESEEGEIFLDGYVWYDEDGLMMFFNNDGSQYDEMNWNGTFANTYNQLKFDQLTGWSQWIEVNEQEASPYSPSGVYAPITADGFEMEEVDGWPLVAKK